MPQVSFPWPPKQLFPNFKRSHHWTAYHKHCRNARTLGWGLVAAEIGPKLRQYEAPGRLAIRIQARPPKRGGRVPDDDGLIGAAKHYLDGISSALGIDDSRFSIGAVEWLPKEGAGELLISFD
jgi:crossover junction endodeoxyribonuclease RusA